MTHIELMSWLILSLEVSAGLLMALIVLGTWSWRRHSRLAGTMDRLVGQIERAQKQRGGELTGLFGERCPAEVLEQAVQTCLDRERALLMAVAESLRQRGDADPGRLPSAMQALTQAAVEAGQRSVPPEDPNPEILEQNAELRESHTDLALRLAQTLETQEGLASALAETREAFDVLDQEYRAAFERQTQGPAAGPAVPGAAVPGAAVPGAAAATAADLRGVVTPMLRPDARAADTAAREALQVQAATTPGVGPSGPVDPMDPGMGDAPWPPDDLDLDGLAADLESLGDSAFGASDVEASGDGEIIRIDEEDDTDATGTAPRAAAG